jgi:hypothetical protein
LPNAVHIYWEELTAKQIIALCTSHVTLFCATQFFLIIGNLLLPYFFPLPYQSERKGKAKEEQKANIRDKEECMWQRWRITDCLSAIEKQTSSKKKWRPRKRWSGE